MKVVDDEQRARRKQREELAHEMAREHRQVARVLGAEARQLVERPRPPAREIRRGERQIVEERPGVGVAGVGLEPDAVQLARDDIACDQRRLARAGRTGDPDDRMRARVVEAREQPLALLYVVEPRPAELGERCVGRLLGARPRHRPIGERVRRGAGPTSVRSARPLGRQASPRALRDRPLAWPAARSSSPRASRSDSSRA